MNSTVFQSMLDNRQHHDLTHDELINILIQSEWEDRENKKITRTTRLARFRYTASIGELNFTSSRGLDKTQVLRLAEGSFIDKKENILITGATGVGKSWLASAFGHQACQLGYRMLYFNTQKLFSKLKMMKADGSFTREMARIEKCDPLILDDFGFQQFDTRMVQRCCSNPPLFILNLLKPIKRPFLMQVFPTPSLTLTTFNRTLSDW